MTEPVLRAATPDDVPVIARIWHQAWHEAHDGKVPAAVVALRTSEAFLERARVEVPVATGRRARRRGRRLRDRGR